MEKKIKSLFEFQRFEQNERLSKLIAETESRQAAELSDDDLAIVSAAGEIDVAEEYNEKTNKEPNV